MKQLLCVALIALNFVIIHAMTDQAAEIISCAKKIKTAIGNNGTFVQEILTYAQQLRLDLIMNLVETEVNTTCNADEITAFANFLLSQKPALNIIRDVVGNFSSQDLANIKQWFTPPINYTALITFFLTKFGALPPDQLAILKATETEDMVEFLPNPTSATTSNSKISEIFNNITSMAQSGNIDGITKLLGGVSSVPRGINPPIGIELPTGIPISMDATIAPIINN